MTKTGTLELWQGGAAVTPLLEGVLGRTRTRAGLPSRLRAPAPDELRHGVPTANGPHLVTMFRTERGWLVADSGRLRDVAVELGLLRRGQDDGKDGQDNPVATPLGTRRLVEEIGLERAEQFGVLTDTEPERALRVGLAELWGLDRLDARGLAQSLTGGGRFGHLLRFSRTDPERGEVGGYSVVVVG